MEMRNAKARHAPDRVTLRLPRQAQLLEPAEVCGGLAKTDLIDARMLAALSEWKGGVSWGVSKHPLLH